MAKSIPKPIVNASLKPEKVYFRNLDSIRFFAALMVFMEHVKSGIFGSLKLKLDGFTHCIWNIFDGGVGVSIFFVLSGFLITYLILTEIKTTGSFSLKDFYIRRVLRIWPLYFLVVAIVFLVFPLIAPLLKLNMHHAANPLYQLTFLSNFDVMRIEQNARASEEMMQNITWSVSIEEQFYAFWPLIFVVLPRRFFLPAILSVIAVSLAFRIHNTGNYFVNYFHTLAVMVDLATGALYAYIIMVSAKVRVFFQQTGTRTILISFILFFLSMMFHDRIFSSPVGMILERPYFSLLFGFIIATQSMVLKPSKLELGNIGFARSLGKYTYGIYLLHPIALYIVYGLFNIANIPRIDFSPIFLSIMCGFALTVILAWASYEFYEKKFLNLKKRFTRIKTE